MAIASNLPIIQYWHTEKVPDDVACLIETFDELNPDLHHKVFSEAEAEEFIAENFTAREVKAFRTCAVPAMQADYFRYCAVFALGGIYVDADFRCIANLRPLLPAAKRAQLFRGPKGGVINGIFAFGSPGHGFLELALEITTANIERRISDRVYFTTGPPIFTSLVNLHRHGSFDGLISRMADSPVREFLCSYCATIDDYAKVGAACEGVEVGGIGGHRAYVRSANGPLSYKSSDMHWLNFEGEIFRGGPG